MPHDVRRPDTAVALPRKVLTKEKAIYDAVWRRDGTEIGRMGSAPSGELQMLAAHFLIEYEMMELQPGDTITFELSEDQDQD